MATGHPDWLSFLGRSAEGEALTSYSFTGTLAAGETGTIDTPTIPAGQEYTYQNLTMSCNDDTSIHKVALEKSTSTLAWFIVSFITGGIFDFPGQTWEAGEFVRIRTTNNSDRTLTFHGAINWVERTI